MKRVAKYALLFSALLVFMGGGAGIYGKDGAAGGDFFLELRKTDPVRRDGFLDGRINTSITGRGEVQSVEPLARYHRKFRIMMAAVGVENPRIILYVFTDRSDYLKILNKGDLFEFRGQLTVYTPLNARRDSYILDIVLEDGAVVVR